MKDIRQQVAESMKQARLEAGLTQKELGQKVGVGEPTINKYESGNQNMTVQTLKRVADALGMKLAVTFRK